MDVLNLDSLLTNMQSTHPFQIKWNKHLILQYCYKLSILLDPSDHHHHHQKITAISPGRVTVDEWLEEDSVLEKESVMTIVPNPKQNATQLWNIESLLLMHRNMGRDGNYQSGWNYLGRTASSSYTANMIDRSRRYLWASEARLFRLSWARWQWRAWYNRRSRILPPIQITCRWNRCIYNWHTSKIHPFQQQVIRIGGSINFAVLKSLWRWQGIYIAL